MYRPVYRPYSPTAHRPNSPTAHQLSCPAAYKPVYRPYNPTAHRSNRPIAHQPYSPIAHRPNSLVCRPRPKTKRVSIETSRPQITQRVAAAARRNTRRNRPGNAVAALQESERSLKRSSERADVADRTRSAERKCRELPPEEVNDAGISPSERTLTRPTGGYSRRGPSSVTLQPSVTLPLPN